MVYYIFSFSYLDKKKMIELKNSFLFNLLSKNYDLNFITKKNFHNFFSEKHLNLRDIFSGKYLIFSLKNKNISFQEVLKDLEIIKTFLTSFETDIFFFNIVYNDFYYFNEFLIESNKYNINKIIDLMFITKCFLSLFLFKMEIIKYVLYFNRINNLNLIKNKYYISYYL